MGGGVQGVSEKFAGDQKKMEDYIGCERPQIVIRKAKTKEKKKEKKKKAIKSQ